MPSRSRTFHDVLLALVFAALAAASPAASAPPLASPHWTPATPFGGSMIGLAQAPSAPQVLYAVAQPSRFFASADGGATWREGAALSTQAPGVDLSVDPHDAQTVYALAAGALQRTQDSGRHWSGLGPESQYVLALTPDSEDSHVLYAGTLSGLYRSTDGGGTWSQSAFPDRSVLAVAGDPQNNGVLFAAVAAADSTDGTAAIWKSSDHGASWVAGPTLNPQTFDSFFTRFVFDPARPGTIYAVFTGEFNLGPVFRSTDDAASWTLLAEAAGVRDLAASPDGVLFAATDFGISHSDDRGETWVPKLPIDARFPVAPRDAIRRILVSAAEPGGVIAAGGAGIWKSGPRGLLWNASNQGIVALGESSLAATPTGPDTVYAVASTGIFRSTNQGGAWTRVHSLLNWPYPIVISAFDPRHPQTLYGIGSDGQADFIVESTDGGGSWRRLPVPYSCGGDSICSVDMIGLALDPDNPDTVYVAGSYFYHFGGSGDFLLRSDDGFATLQRLRPVPHLAALVFAPGRSGAMFAVDCKRLLKSEDRGRSWRTLGRGLPQSLCSGVGWGAQMLAFDPSDPQRVYIGTGGQGVFASTDGGATFRPMNRGLESAKIATLLIDPKNSGRLYAATAARGVFQWTASLRKWTPLNQGLPLASFNGVLALDPQSPSILYAGTFDQGVFRLDVGD
jgi:photosystem II stability/assembly factor-like uncharacterized protein